MSSQTIHISPSKRPKVFQIVVLGVGYAGTLFLHDLKESAASMPPFEVTIIDRREYFENGGSSVRFLVHKDFYDSNAALLEKIYTPPHFNLKINVVIGTASTILPTNQVIVSLEKSPNAQEIIEVPFDFLILGTGMKYPLFKGETPSFLQRREEVARITAKIKEARSITLVGGGPVGCEVAGEILSAYPHKSVTLIHIGSKLLDGCSYFVRLRATATLRSQGANILLRQKIQSVQTQQQGLPQLILTNRGNLVESDLIITTAGNGSPNTEMLEEYFSDSLASSKQVKVAKSLLVRNTSNIFALGDIADLPNNGKLFTNIPQQSKIVIHNLALLMEYDIDQTKFPRLSSYESGVKSPVLISIGKDFGIKVEKGFFRWFKSGLLIGHLKTRSWEDWSNKKFFGDGKQIK